MSRRHRLQVSRHYSRSQISRCYISKVSRRTCVCAEMRRPSFRQTCREVFNKSSICLQSRLSIRSSRASLHWRVFSSEKRRASPGLVRQARDDPGAYAQLGSPYSLTANPKANPSSKTPLGCRPTRRGTGTQSISRADPSRSTHRISEIYRVRSHRQACRHRLVSHGSSQLQEQAPISNATSPRGIGKVCSFAF